MLVSHKEIVSKSERNKVQTGRKVPGNKIMKKWWKLTSISTLNNNKNMKIQ